MTLADYFQSDRELTQRFIDIQLAGMGEGMMFRLIGGKEWPELEELKGELAAAGVEVPVWEGGVAGYEQVAAVMNTLLFMEVSVSPAVSIEALLAPAGPPAVACSNARGIPESVWLADLAGGRTWVKLDVADRHLKIEAEGVRDLPGLFAAMGVAIAEALRNPRTMGLEKRIWKPSREFDPRCVTSLRITGFKWHVGSPNKIVVLQLEEAGEVIVQAEPQVRKEPFPLPRHPTLAAPWRLLEIGEEGTLWEQEFGATAEKAWLAYVDDIFEMATSFPRIEPGGSREELLACYERRGADEVIVLPAKLNRGRELRFRIERDDEELCFSSNHGGASQPGREAAKAREIWFQRFAGVIAAGLPEPRWSLRYVLDKGMPKSPLRTFVASLRDGCQVERPACEECGKPCDRVVHLDLRHHPQRGALALPGTSLLMFTCGEDNLCGEWWHQRWLTVGEAAMVIPSLLESAEEIESGPAYRELDYDKEAVDRDLFDLDDERWSDFENSGDQNYFMFACPGTKVGGWPSWIQGDCTPCDAEGKAMEFVGQVGCYPLIEIGDSGEAYVFYSAGTGETMVVTQCF